MQKSLAARKAKELEVGKGESGKATKGQENV